MNVNSELVYILLICKNKIASAVSDANCIRFAVNIFPKLLNALSELADVAGVCKYRRASFASPEISIMQMSSATHDRSPSSEQIVKHCF